MGNKGKDKAKKIKRKRRTLGQVYFDLLEQIKKNKKAYIVYLIINTSVIFAMIRSIIEGRWENVATCLFASILLLLPPIIEKSLKINLPTTMEVVAYIFVFAVEILGEIGNYYERFPHWDTALHTLNGFMFAAFGFCLVDIFNRHERFSFKLSAGYLAFVAFCFSMTIGVLWEFFEYSADHYLGLDMQKDTVVTSFNSVYLDENKSNTPIPVNDIKYTEVVYDGDKTFIIEGGYLDIGLEDTIDDLLVNFIGAATFSLMGYVFIRFGGNSKIVENFVPVIEEDEDEAAKAALKEEETNEELEAYAEET